MILVREDACSSTAGREEPGGLGLGSVWLRPRAKILIKAVFLPCTQRHTQPVCRYSLYTDRSPKAQCILRHIFSRPFSMRNRQDAHAARLLRQPRGADR